MKSLCVCVGAALLLSACGPSEKEKARMAEERRLECLDKYCEGDVEPAHDPTQESLIKVNGHWFIAPKRYAKGLAGLAFYWPSKDPVTSNSTKGQDFSDVAIEIFLRSNSTPLHGPSRYKALQLAQEQGRVLEKHQVRPDLEVWRVQGENKGLPPAMWYAATDLKDANGEPPVLGCHDMDPKFGSCTMAFGWKPGIAADLRFSPKHAQDWPEIYQEVVRVLNLIKEEK
jgi:hypothetical protein